MSERGEKSVTANKELLKSLPPRERARARAQQSLIWHNTVNVNMFNCKALIMMQFKISKCLND